MQRYKSFLFFQTSFLSLVFAVLLLLVFIVLLLLVFIVLLLLVFDVLLLLVFDVAKTHKHFNIKLIDPSFLGTISYSFIDIVQLQDDFPHRLRWIRSAVVWFSASGQVFSAPRRG